jgi:hypothetical protein
MDITGANFVGVGGEDLDLQNITVDENFSRFGGDSVRIYNPLTGTYTTAFYWGEIYESADADDPMPDTEGWGDANQTLISGISISAGQGFWVKSAKAGKLTIAGQVADATDNKVATLANAMDLVCNPYPVSIDLQKIGVDEDFSRFGGDSLRVYDKTTGKYTTVFFWGELYESADASDPMPETEGWGDANQTLISGVTIAPGQGFWVKSAKAANLVFPAP